jgi:uncharacterized membrane protein YtjA (UPF0391 family)
MKSPASPRHFGRLVIVAQRTRLGSRQSENTRVSRTALPARGEVAHQVHLLWRRLQTMLHWSLVFLVIAIIAAILGFGGVAGAAAGIAKILFFIFLVIWIVALLFGRRAI